MPFVNMNADRTHLVNKDDAAIQASDKRVQEALTSHKQVKEQFSVLDVELNALKNQMVALKTAHKAKKEETTEARKKITQAAKTLASARKDNAIVNKSVLFNNMRLKSHSSIVKWVDSFTREAAMAAASAAASAAEPAAEPAAAVAADAAAVAAAPAAAVAGCNARAMMHGTVSVRKRPAVGAAAGSACKAPRVVVKTELDAAEPAAEPAVVKQEPGSDVESDVSHGMDPASDEECNICEFAGCKGCAPESESESDDDDSE
jgi:chromosome segregation ATPase